MNTKGVTANTNGWAANEGATTESIVLFVPSNIHTESRTVFLLSSQADWWGLHPEFKIFNDNTVRFLSNEL